MSQKLHIVHVTPSFAAAGAQMRTAGIINHLGPGARHTVFSRAENYGAREHIQSGIDITCLAANTGGNVLRAVTATAGMLRRQKPDLIFTYNWGSMDAVLAAVLTRIAPVIHFEDGFGPDEAVRQKRRRVWYRRLLLPHVEAVVAPSRNLAKIMREVWRLPEDKIHYIPNGIDVDRFAPARPAANRKEEIVVGTVGHLRPEKRQDRLLTACAELGRTRKVRLLVAGEGAERESLEAKAAELNIRAQVEFLGHVTDPREVYRRLDIFALSSCTEQMPISVLEAMSMGLPVLSTDVGDIKEMVGDKNRPFIVPDFEDYRQALARLSGDASLRTDIGLANRARCTQKYGLEGMLEQHRTLYERAIAQKIVQPLMEGLG